MKNLKEIAQSHKTITYFLSFTSLLLGIVIVAQAFFIASIVDRIFINGAAFDDVLHLLVTLLLVFGARSLLSHFHKRIGLHMAAVVKKDFRKALLEQYIGNPVQTSIKEQSGYRVSFIMDAIDEIDPYFSKYYPQRIQSMVIPCIILAAFFWQNWLSAIILLVTAPLIPICMIIIGRITERKAEQQIEQLSRFSGKFLDSLQGLVTLKLLGKAKGQQSIIKQSSINFRQATMEVLKVAFLSSLMLELISMLGIALVAIEVGLRLVLYQNISFFVAFFVLVLAPEFYQLLKDFGSAFHAGKGSLAAANKIGEELEKGLNPDHWGEQSLSLADIPPKIKLKDVSFSYGDNFSLNRLNTTIHSGTQVAIVGRSGAGKSTLLHVIAGLYPLKNGFLTVNDKPLYYYKEQDWYRQLGYISQDPYLFSGTIAENIAIARDDTVTRAELEDAAKQAGLTLLLADLTEGLETKIGEGGRGLSGGEKQRIALARTFLKKPSLILFDEPTIGLDLQTEQILQASIKELAKTATVITVAHRLHTIKEADQILFLENGTLIASGTHDELFKSTSDYQKMFETQRGGVAG